jgi:flavin reductase
MAGTDPVARPDAAVQVMPAQQNGRRRHAELRGVLGLFATGVGILTAISDGPCGMTANAFTSVSLEPPLVLVCVKQDAEIHRAIVESQSFVISVLGAHQEEIARYFADHGRPRGNDEFAVLRWVPAPQTGGPIVQGAIAWIECSLTEVHDGGDHSIFLGSVLNIGRSGGRDALLFFGGGFHRLEHRQA